MRRAVELPDVHHVVFVLEHGGLVVVDVEVVGRAEDGHHAGEAGRARFAVHAVAGVLGFVGPDDGEEVVLFEECAGGGVGEEVGAATYVVVHEEFGGLFLAEFFEWVGPENVAHEAVGGGLAEAVNLGMSVFTMFVERCARVTQDARF